MADLIKVLFLASSPEDWTPLHLDREIKAILQRIRTATPVAQIRIEQEWALSPEEIPAALMRHQPHIVHFSGHGDSDGALVLMNATTRTMQKVAPAVLARVFSTLPGQLCCVVLNACFTQAQAAGIAQAIPTVVGMAREVSDEAAITFAAGFYEALAFGQSVKKAFELGRVQMELAGQTDESATPQLTERGGVDAGQLYPIRKKAAVLYGYASTDGAPPSIVSLSRTASGSSLASEPAPERPFATAQPAPASNHASVQGTITAPTNPGRIPMPDLATVPVDFLLVAPLKEEREALLAHLHDPHRLPPDEQDVRIYYQAEVPTTLPGGMQGSYRVIVTSPLGMGRVEATTATVDAIRRWQPRYVLLVGIAGGDPAEVALGDVLVAEQLADYEQQKLTDAKAKIRYQSYRTDARLYGAAQHLLGWEAAVKQARPVKGKPGCHFGVVMTGDKVQAATDALKPYRSDWPKLIGVEMEAGGVAAAAWQAPSKPGVLMVRGVSDLADAKKGSARVKKWRPYACDVAAAYAVALLRSGPVPLAVSATSPATAGTVGVSNQGTGNVVGASSISSTGHQVAVNVSQGTEPAMAGPHATLAQPAPRPTTDSLHKLLVEVGAAGVRSMLSSTFALFKPAIPSRSE